MFVGRDREMSELERALEPLVAGRGAVFLFAGEPGIGKTHLATEVADRAAARGVRVAWGRCWEAGGAPAFWPWREALGGLGIGFPEGSTIATTDPTEARFALFRAVAESLAGTPRAIVLEDLHAADLSTLLLLEFVAGQLRSLPLLLIGTYRDLEASLRAEVGGSLARAGRHGSVMPLGRLREPDVAALVRDAIDGADEQLQSSVYETTNGNPLFVKEIVRVRASGIATGIPLGVREVIRQRLELVDDRRALEAAAVLGVEFGIAELERMVPGATLDIPTKHGIVTITGVRARFSHALYREALYAELARDVRCRLHRDASRALAATGAPLAEVAHHLLESGPDAAIEGIDAAIRAASQALDQFAFEDASALLERARLAIPEGPLESRMRCRVSIASGEVRIRSGDVTGREICREAAQVARELGDWTLLAQAGLAYGSVFTVGGVDPILVGILEEAFERLPAEDTGLRAHVMARLAAARQPSPPPLRRRDLELALESIAIGRRVADRRELLRILQAASGALYGAAEPRIRLPVSSEQQQIAEELGDIPRLLTARMRLAMDHLELGDFASYAQLADAYEALANRVGRAAMPWRVGLMRSMVALAHDRFDESERQQAASRAADSELPRARRAQAMHRLCFLRATERHAEIRAALPELRGLWMQMPFGVHLADARVASMLAWIGATDEVRAIVSTMSPDAADEQINTIPLADAAWSIGDRELARRLMPLLLPMERWMSYWLDVEYSEAPSTRSLAYMHGILGDWTECDRLWTSALRDVESIGRKAMGARMRYELGDLLLRFDREHDRARALLAEARTHAVGDLVALIDRHGATQRTFAIRLEGEYYAIEGTRETLRFKASRGMQYLAQLLERPNVEIHVLDLVGSSEADRGDAGEVLDARATREYKARLEQLRDQLEDAEERGLVDRAESIREEMEAIARGLKSGTGLGGRARRVDSAVDRARSAVQRRIKDAIDRIAEQDAELGERLRRVVRTGNTCSYAP